MASNWSTPNIPRLDKVKVPAKGASNINKQTQNKNQIKKRPQQCWKDIKPEKTYINHDFTRN